MTGPDTAAKLRMIARLTADELPAYEAVARERGFYDGEQAALVRRRRELGVRDG